MTVLVLFGPPYRLVARLPINLSFFEFVDQGSREGKRVIPHITKHGWMLRFLGETLLVGVQVHPLERRASRGADILATAILAVVRFLWAIGAQIHAGTHVRYPRAIEIEGYLVSPYFTVFVRRTSQQIL